MRFTLGPWPAYFLVAVMTVLMATSLSACRFGNQVVSGSVEDGFTGYYQSTPKTLDFCTNLQGGSSNCVNITQEQINNYVPGLIYEVMSNPVAFALTNLESGEGLLFAPSGSKALPLYVNKEDKTVSVLASNDPAPPLWGDENCTHHFSLSALGALKPGTEVVISGLKTVGRLEIGFEVLDVYSGNCAAVTAEMESCYFDHTTCGGADEIENLAMQQDVRNFYLPYIVSGAMTASQIGDVVGLGYEVTYE